MDGRHGNIQLALLLVFTLLAQDRLQTSQRDVPAAG